MRLILNADDFGLTPGINRAIAELHSAGALTSATLMANGPAFDDAVRIAQAHPTLGIGCHIVLVDGTPLSPPETIPTLLGPDGKTFRTSLTSLLRAVLLGKVNPSEIERETSAQVNRLQQANLRITHIDTHKHTHVLPTVARLLLAAAEHLGIRAIRNPFEPTWSTALGNTPPLRRTQVNLTRLLQPKFFALPQLRRGTILTTDGTLGIAATGHLNANTLSEILQAMPEGTWELVCHPGYNDADLDAITTRLRVTRETELQALLAAFANASNPNGPHLINYKSIS